MANIIRLEDLKNGKSYKICKDGTCLFCNSKCPVCGSARINVGFMPLYEFEKDTFNEVRVVYKNFDIQLYCNMCGSKSGIDKISVEHDSHFKSLAGALMGILGLPAQCVVKNTPQEDGTHLNVNEHLIWE